MKCHRRVRRSVGGFTLIEILIALFMLAFGMLALARVIGRSAQEEMEAYQRSQAMSLALEMADRITNNPKQAALYVEDYAPVGNAEDCTALDPAVTRPRCDSSAARNASTLSAPIVRAKASSSDSAAGNDCVCWSSRYCRRSSRRRT